MVVAGAPAVRGGTVWFLSRDGVLVGRSLADGSPIATVALNVLPAGGPVAVGDDLAVPRRVGDAQALARPTTRALRGDEAVIRRSFALTFTLLLALSASSAVHGPAGAQYAPAAKAEIAPAPKDQDLLSSIPFDRLTLTDGAVLRIEPVLPRPLPPYDPAKEKKKHRAKTEIPPEGNIPLPGQKAKVVEPPVEPDDEENAGNLVIHLLEGEIRDFRVKRANIKSIDYFEDMLLAESDRYVIARDFARAFECCLRVQALNAGWKGLDEHVNRLLFAEGSAALLDNDGDRGLRLLGELSARKPDYPGLADKLATSYGTRAARAFELGLYAKGRKILHDVEPMAPDHVFLREVRERFVNRARALVKAAEKDKGRGRLDKLTEALRVWPALEGAGAAYREAFAAEPTLDVAVDDVPRGVGPWVRTPADERVTRLLFLPVLARDDEEAMQGKTPGQLAAEVTTTDLGRRLVVRLRPGVPWSDGSRPVAAIDIARALTDAAEPTSPRYSARWADLLDRVEVPDATHVEVRLTRVFLRPGAWLLGPVGPAHAAVDGRSSAADRGRELVDDGRSAGPRVPRPSRPGLAAGFGPGRPRGRP